MIGKTIFYYHLLEKRGGLGSFNKARWNIIVNSCWLYNAQYNKALSPDKGRCAF